MATYFDNNSSDQQWQSIQDAIESGSLKQVARTINKGLTPSDLAHLLESSPPRQRKIIWQLIEADYRGEVLQYLNEDVQAYFLSQLNAQEVIDATEDLDTDDLADILQNLPETITSEVLDSMDTQDRERVEEILSYEEDTAGGLMNTEYVDLHESAKVADAFAALRGNEELLDTVNTLFLIDADERLVGVVPLAKLFVASADTPLRDLATDAIIQVSVDEDQKPIVELFDKYNLLTLPVLDEDGKMAGVITADDVISVLRGH